MKIICIGDAVSAEGIDCIARFLPSLKREYRPDVVIVNGENSALGNGIDRSSYEALINAGADIVTGGNHSFQKKSANELHEDEARLLRPANVDEFVFGSGVLTLDMGRYRLRVINLSGELYMNRQVQNPFLFADSLGFDDKNTVTVVDFHAEATSEKQALGYYLDGRASLVFGTHTHVQTADECILEGGTGYITDIGMTGVKESVLGKDKDVCVHNFVHPDDRLQIKDAKGKCELCGIFAEIDETTKKCISIKRIKK